MDWVPWVIRAILIVVGITMAIMVSKRKREGIYQGRYYFGIIVIGITALILGGFLLIVSFITDLSLFYALYLIAVGAIAIIIGLVVRNKWEKNR
jgi:predicted permease